MVFRDSHDPIEKRALPGRPNLRPNSVFTRLALISIWVAWMLTSSPLAIASEEEDVLTARPRAIMEETAGKVVAILAQRDRSSEERVEAIKEIAYGIFDFQTMSKLVLARNWRKLDPEERVEFVEEFKRHLSRTYGSRLDRYNQEKVDVYGAQVEPRNDVTIKTRILGGEFDGAEVAYRFRNREEQWRIIDVVIEGVSLVSNYRSQFAEVLSSGTIDDLLVRLRDKNFQIEEEDGKPVRQTSARR